MMRRKMKQLMGILFSLALMLGLIPGMGLTVLADEPYASLKNTITVVHFDSKDWYLIDYDSSTVTLLAKECVGASAFNSNGLGNEYSGSTVESAVNTYYTNSISSDAKTAVNGNGMFLLTIEQARTIHEATLHNNCDVLKCSWAEGAETNFWWLCSPDYRPNKATFVGGTDGYVWHGTRWYVDAVFGVRPALKLNLSSVTFSSDTNTFSLKTGDQPANPGQQGNPDQPANPDDPGTNAAVKDIRAFVERLYVIMLGRASDPAGIDDWTNQLVSKTNTGAGVAQGFILSKELKEQDISDEEFIQRLYRTFFNSEGDEAGKAYWLDKLKRGYSRKYVFRGFAESDQYSGLCADYNIERGNVKLSEKDQECSDDNLHIDKEKVGQYIDRLFQTILGRDGDPSGRQYWIDRIAGREEKAASVAMRGFFTSDEYKNLNKTDEEFIKDVYRAILGREADANGIAYWKEKLASGEYTRSRLIEVGFGNSDEFADILRGYGLKMAK